MSRRDAGLQQAYRRARYRVLLDGAALELRVGEASPALAELLAASGVTGAAFVTACNPGSRLTDSAANATAQAALEARCAGAGHRLLPGEALDPTGAWPAESSVLILGIGRQAALKLAVAFGQNAFLWIDRRGEPHLDWTTGC